MMKIYLLRKCLLFSLLIMLSSNSYSMLCPTNFNVIEIGYSIDQVINLCGVPSQRSEYKETIKFSTNETDGETYGSYSQSRNNYYSQSQGTSAQLHNVKEKIIIHTKLIYGMPQPSALIFENGTLKHKEMIYK